MMVKRILVLSGLCLGGILSASDPEAALKKSVNNLEALLYEACQAKRDQASIPWEAITNETKAALDDFVLSSSCLTQNKRLSYLNLIRGFSEAFVKLNE
jgi:hypothetical protein